MNPDQHIPAPDAMKVVLAWWQAIQDKDIDALARTLDGDFISVGGPGGRTIGRASALTHAQAFLTSGVVHTWRVHDVLQRVYGDTVVCSYIWEETGRHLDTDFEMGGIATDVVTRTGSGWKMSAHHTSILP